LAMVGKLLAQLQSYRVVAFSIFKIKFI